MSCGPCVRTEPTRAAKGYEVGCAAERLLGLGCILVGREDRSSRKDGGCRRSNLRPRTRRGSGSIATSLSARIPVTTAWSQSQPIA